jgi:hypothetical protein
MQVYSRLGTVYVSKSETEVDGVVSRGVNQVGRSTVSVVTVHTFQVL